MIIMFRGGRGEISIYKKEVSERCKFISTVVKQSSCISFSFSNSRLPWIEEKTLNKEQTSITRAHSFRTLQK